MAKRYLIITLVAATLSSCSIYHPQAVDIPLIDHAGDSRIDVAGSVSNSDMALNGTYSYGFTNCIAGQVHFNVSDHMFCGQLAGGAYKPFGDHGVLEGYVGYNSGYVKSEADVDDASSLNSKYQYDGYFAVPFGQINIGWKWPHLDLGLGLKVGSYIPDINYNEYSYDQNGNKNLSISEQYTEKNLLIEPQFILRVGSEHFKWCFKAQFSKIGSVDSWNIGTTNLTYDTFSISSGLNISFGGRNDSKPVWDKEYYKD